MSGCGPDRSIDRDTHLTIIARAGRFPRRLDRDECRERLRVAWMATLLPFGVVMAGFGSGLLTIVLLALTLVVRLVLRSSRPARPGPGLGGRHVELARYRPSRLPRRRTKHLDAVFL